jgi:Zn-dependent protease
LSTISNSVPQNCAQCGADLPFNAQICPHCQALVHGIRLDQLALDARALENRGLLRQASELWTTTLTLLPAGSQQASWVHARLEALTQAEAAETARANGQPIPQIIPPATSGSGKPKPPPPNWVKKLGPFGPVALFLLKFKSAFFLLFKLKFLFSFALYVALYVSLFGWRFGLGFSACIFIHEMGHYIDVRRRGLPAEMPMFIPGLGAYVRWTALGVTRRQIAQIAIAGPLAGWFAAAVCYLLFTQTHDPIWSALARTGAWLNILNLIPVWFFDGGLAARALSTAERAGILMLSIALWYVTGEGVFLIVALGAAWALFTAIRNRDESLPTQSDWSIWAYYAAVLVALAVVIHFVPNTMADRGFDGRNSF